ncbi:tyrosyl-DNA phosphodiesterase 1 isoform X3 [Macadamia integrifolia]|uniref:tyrosyl-DNA phosphodiesterase 1 isoform X3 n=1 Tax=Macadamia integrifolia TaxID=60698 RepID=UPI001C4EE739|nr:tyrosyl-DNA phosphodiesterase 1 isoform X3 [Macadamia integrifolia]
MPYSQIGFLVPLNNNLEEDDSASKLPILEGVNILGRDNFSVSDKRVSRKHISLKASLDGSAEVVVEGSNPVVIRAGDQRKKLYSKDKATIAHGDILELIPGHHVFKYVIPTGAKDTPSPQTRKRSSEEGRKLSEDELLVKKRRQIFEDEAFARNLQAELADNSPVQERSLGIEICQSSRSHRVMHEVVGAEPIRHFSVHKDRLPLTFRLLQVQGLPPWANTSSVSIRDVIQGNVLVAILSNYMVDIDWLISACPAIKKIPHVLVIHGEGDGTLDHLKKVKPANWILHKPPLPISYGTHHSKAMLLVYPRGVRIIVHTANLIHVDWNNKSQGLWMQDFPWKDQKDLKKGHEFENDVIDYLSVLKWPEFSVNLPDIGNVTINSSFFKKFNYSSAAVRLIASVPGYHTGPNLKKWGHMKLRTILQESVFDKEFQKSPLVYQGYAAGNAIPSPQKNVEKDFLKKYWAKWKATHTGRCRAMPHIKTYTRYSGQKLAWFLLTSANLSKAAWGALQKNNSQLMIRSYELGVLFLPSSTKDSGYLFSCTDNGGSSEVTCGSSQNAGGRKRELVTLCWRGNQSIDSSSEVIPLPVPYELPPQPYSSEDVPWSWDRRCSKKDVYGQVWPRQVKLYVSQDS